MYFLDHTTIQFCDRLRGGVTCVSIALPATDPCHSENGHTPWPLCSPHNNTQIEVSCSKQYTMQVALQGDSLPGSVTFSNLDIDLSKEKVAKFDLKLINYSNLPSRR